MKELSFKRNIAGLTQGAGILAGGALLGLSVNAQAALTENLTMGNAKALAMGNAVTADPPGIDSVHYNPAGLSLIEGRQSQLKVIAGDFSIIMEMGDYVQDRKDFIAEKLSTGVYSERYFYDESLNTTSETEGAALVLPVSGLTDLPVLLAPIGGLSYSPPQSKLTFATNVYAPLMVGFYRADDDPGRFIGQRLSFSVFTYFSPSVAYEVSDELSIGATITFNYAGVGIQVPFRSGHEGFAFLYELQEQACDPDAFKGPDSAPDGINPDDFGWVGVVPCQPRDERIQFTDQLGELSFEVENPLTYGVNVGALWRPTPWASFGVVLQSPVEMQMEGDFEWINGDSWISFLQGILMDSVGKPVLSNGLGKKRVEGGASLDMEMPMHFSIGTSLQVTQRLKINADYKFTEWSSWQSIPVEFTEPIDFLRIAEYIQPELSKKDSLVFPLGLEDTWTWGVGIEYRQNDMIAYRLGVEDRPSSIPKENRSPLLPIGSGKLWGAGLVLNLEDGSILDLGVGYFASKVDMPGGTSRLGNSLDPTLAIYNPYQGQDIKVDMSTTLLELSYQRKF